MTFQLDVQFSVGVFHTVMKGLLGKGGPLRRLQEYGNAVKKRATTERNPCMLDASFCHVRPTVTCHMLITRPGARIDRFHCHAIKKKKNRKLFGGKWVRLHVG